MATDVLMPQMGESITEGTVVKWLKKVGETVQRDEPLLEISTDKVDAEIPAPAAGVVIEILAKEGDTVAVNSVLARLGEAGEAGAGVSAAAAGAAPAIGEATPAREAPRQVEAPPAQADGDSRPLPSQAPAPPQPQAAPPQPPPQARAMPTAPPAPAPEGVGRARSSPLVRNIAREHGVRLEHEDRRVVVAELSAKRVVRAKRRIAALEQAIGGGLDAEVRDAGRRGRGEGTDERDDRATMRGQEACPALEESLDRSGWKQRSHRRSARCPARRVPPRCGRVDRAPRAQRRTHPLGAFRPGC